MYDQILPRLSRKEIRVPQKPEANAYTMREYAVLFLSRRTKVPFTKGICCGEIGIIR